MTVYLLYVASPILVAIILNMMTTKPINDTDNWRKTYLIVCGIIMALMIGLRNPSVGSRDTMRYVDIYNSLRNMSFSDFLRTDLDLESGYLLTVWLLSHVFHNSQWLLMLSGIFFTVAVCHFAYRNCKNLTLALLVFNSLGLFNFMVQGMRQAIAMCICLWALEQIKEKKNIRFLLLVALASTFHASAIVFVALYPISKLTLSLKGILLFSILALFVVRALPTLFELVNQAINDSYVIGTGAVSGGVVAIFIYLAIIIFGLTFIDSSDPHYPMFIYMAVLGTISMIMRNTVNVIIERIAHYFSFGLMATLANSTHTIRNPNTRILISYLAGLLMLGVAVYKSSYSVLIPYTFFWQ